MGNGLQVSVLKMWKREEMSMGAEKRIYISIGEGSDRDCDAGVLSERVLDSGVPLFLQLAAEVDQEG